MLFKYKKCSNCQKKFLKSEAFKTNGLYFCTKNCCEEFHELMKKVHESGLDKCCG